MGHQPWQGWLKELAVCEGWITDALPAGYSHDESRPRRIIVACIPERRAKMTCCGRALNERFTQEEEDAMLRARRLLEDAAGPVRFVMLPLQKGARRAAAVLFGTHDEDTDEYKLTNAHSVAELRRLEQMGGTAVSMVDHATLARGQELAKKHQLEQLKKIQAEHKSLFGSLFESGLFGTEGGPERQSQKNPKAGSGAAHAAGSLSVDVRASAERKDTKAEDGREMDANEVRVWQQEKVPGKDKLILLMEVLSVVDWSDRLEKGVAPEEQLALRLRVKEMLKFIVRLRLPSLAIVASPAVLQNIFRVMRTGSAQELAGADAEMLDMGDSAREQKKGGSSGPSGAGEQPGASDADEDAFAAPENVTYQSSWVPMIGSVWRFNMGKDHMNDEPFWFDREEVQP